VTVADSGNVGIGTTAPASLLHIQGTPPGTSGSMINVRDSAANGSNTSFSGVFFNSSPGTDYSIGKLSSGSDGLFQIRNGNSGTGYLTINNSGNVGIGTTNPNSKLEVFDGDISVTTSGSFSFLNLNRNFIPNSAGVLLGGMKYRGYSTGTTYQSGASIYSFSSQSWTSTSSPGYLTFQTTPVGSTTPVDRMIVTASGDVGIGTTSPAASIHVAGAIGSTPTGDGFLAGIQSGYAVIHLNGSAATGSLIDFSVSGTDTKGRILYDNINNYFGFNTNGAERLKITSTGDVGIGTSSPSAKLHVIGNATVSATLLTANAKITGTLTDSFNQVGTAGQVLSSTGTGIEWITGGGGGGGSTIIVKDEGTTIGSSFTTLNFIGDNVNATASGSTAVIEVTGRASSGSVYYDDVANPFVIPGG
jgi:hypothetical protein